MYESDGVFAESAETVRNRLDGLRLNSNITVLEYIAEFQVCVSILGKMKEGHTSSKTREMFLDQITATDYHEVMHSFRFHEMPIEECYKNQGKHNHYSVFDTREITMYGPRK